MSFFTRQTVTVPIDDDNKVFIQKPSGGKKLELMSRAGHANVKSDQTQEFVIDLGKLQIEQLIAWIIGWDGPGFENKKPTRQNILELDEAVTEKVLAQINELDQPLSDAEKKT